MTTPELSAALNDAGRAISNLNYLLTQENRKSRKINYTEEQSRTIDLLLKEMKFTPELLEASNY